MKYYLCILYLIINPFVSGQLTSNYYHINTTGTQYYNSGSKMIEIILKENNECCYYTAWRENGLKIRVYGNKGSIEWFQDDPNHLKFIELNKPEKLLLELVM